MKKVFAGFIPIIIPVSSGSSTFTTKDGIAMLIVGNLFCLPGVLKWLLSKKVTPPNIYYGDTTKQKPARENFMDGPFWVAMSCAGFIVLNGGGIAVWLVNFISSHI